MSKNITVIGIGKLGLCTALCFEQAGYDIYGIDVNNEYVKQLNDKEYISYEPNVVEMLNKSNNFIASTNLHYGLNYSDIIFILVDTPYSSGDNYYDHSKLSKVLASINKHKVENKTIIIGCTVIPGYIDKIGKHLLDDCKNVTLNYNPEFIAQGDIINGFLNPDMVLIGAETPESSEIIQDIYKTTCINNPVFNCISPLEAEITKLTINGFITTKIAFANSVGDCCKQYGVNPTNVLNAAGSDSRIGNKYFNYGYSFGGPCFPRDTFALAKVFNDVGLSPAIISATNTENDNHINYQLKEYMQTEDPIVIQGVCYKERSVIPIIEKSAKLKIAYLLTKNGRSVIIKDTQHIIDLVKMEYGNIFKYIAV
jgi:UDPglucose 6-dehydrogenase